MIEMTTLQLLFWAVASLALLLVWVFGARDERLGVALIIGGSVVTALLIPKSGQSFDDFELSVFAADCVVLIGFVWLSFSSHKFWPIWTASLQLITVIIHIVQAVIPERVPAAYAVLQGFWVYPMFLAILSGTYGRAAIKRRNRRERPSSVLDSVSAND